MYMYFSVFYFLCFVTETSTGMLEVKVLECRYLDLEEEGGIIIWESGEEKWRDVVE